MITCQDLWLWWRIDTLYWLNPLDCGNLQPEVSPSNKSHGFFSFAELRQGDRSQAMEDCVGKEVADILRSSLPKQGYLRLHLGDSLPDWLQKAPWSWCNLDAERLSHRIQVEHCSPEPYEDHQATTCNQIRFFDLWPHQAPFLDFVKTYGSKYNIQYDRSVVRATNTLNNYDLSQYSALIITAHGTEDSLDRPFLDENDCAWSLPLDKKLPRLIILIACGSECGNLGTYASRLLNQEGVTAVIAPVGQLDVNAMVTFMKFFLNDWINGSSVSEALASASQKDIERIGAARLCLFGNGSLRIISTNKVLLDQVNSLTLQRYQSTGSFWDVVFQLYKARNLQFDDPHESAYFFRQLDELRGHLWPVTNIWLAPYMAHMAQKHSHNSINYYRNISINNSQRDSAPDDEFFYYYLAGTEYRQGHYAIATHNISKGINSLSGNNKAPCSNGGVKLLGILINILVDLNLPKSAQLSCDIIDRCLRTADYIPNRGYETDRFILLDRQARVSVRNGEIVRAKEQLKRKRAMAINDYEADGLRELATLMLISAWHGTSLKDKLIGEARSALQDVAAVRNVIISSAGLNRQMYILKALGAVAWLLESKTDLKLISHYLSELHENYDYSKDSGPLGALFFYSSMAGDETARKLWPSVEQWLNDDGYYFELAVYSALLKNQENASIYLDRFQKSRRDAITNLSKANMAVGWPGFKIIAGEIAEREILEREMLLYKRPAPEKLALHGLIPL